MLRLLSFALSCSVLLLACGGADEENPSSSASSTGGSGASSSAAPIVLPTDSLPELPGDASLGKIQYEEQCEVCHGANGEGILQFNSPALVDCSICDDSDNLIDYVDTTMPPGNASSQCVGECADNVSAYIMQQFNHYGSVSCDTASEPSPSLLKRLSRLEYSNTLSDLLQLSSAPDVSLIPDDPSVYNFKTVASVQTVQTSHLAGYLAVATAQAEALLSDTARREQVLGCDLNSAGCLESFTRSFGRLAFRRPLEEDQVTRIVGFASANGASATEQFIAAIEVMLTSPNFIFRVEVGDSTSGLANLNSYELASRLAFALWGRGPSAQLLDRAASGELDTEAGLRQVAEDMLSDPRAKSSLADFFSQWLAINLLREPVETPANWTDTILDDMRDETQQLLGEYVWQDQDFMGVFTESRSYMSGDLANYYGLASPESSTSAVTLPANDPRYGTGILTHAANMFAKTDGDLVAIRGNWLRSTFLCKELKLPNGINEIINGKFAGFTHLEIVEARNTDAACERCHAQIDPIGVAFAPFSRAGLYDHLVDVGEYPIEPGFPELNDPSVRSVRDIAEALANMPEVGACLADRLFLYTRNRLAEDGDQCAVKQANADFYQSGRRFKSLLLSLVEDPNFRVRMTPDPAQTPVQEAEPVNIALGSAVSVSDAQDGNPGSRLTDGDITGASRWSAQYFPQEAVIDLGGNYTVVQTEVLPYFDRAYRYTIELSEDGSNYSMVVDRSSNDEGGNAISDLISPTSARYVRITVTGVTNDETEWASLREVRIYGTAN